MQSEREVDAITSEFRLTVRADTAEFSDGTLEAADPEKATSLQFLERGVYSYFRFRIQRYIYIRIYIGFRSAGEFRCPRRDPHCVSFYFIGSVIHPIVDTLSRKATRRDVTLSQTPNGICRTRASDGERRQRDNPSSSSRTVQRFTVSGMELL